MERLTKLFAPPDEAIRRGIWHKPKLPDYIRTKNFRDVTILAVVFAVLWWLLSLRSELAVGRFLPTDQIEVFLLLPHNLIDPYVIPRFVNVPHTALLMLPFGLLPTNPAILAQMIFYFMLLGALICKYEGGWRIALLVFASPFAFDTAIEINLEWMIVIGLLLPRVWSAPFLIVKPQDMIGYYFSFTIREVIWTAVIVLVVIALSFVLWPDWPAKMSESVQENTLGDNGDRVNMAPSVMFTRWLTYPIGLVLALIAFRRKDTEIGVLAGIMLVPYITFYGLMPAFAMLATRWPKSALVVSGAMWILTWPMIALFLQTFV